jgi:sugar phosphate isomerase/epimerase
MPGATSDPIAELRPMHERISVDSVCFPGATFADMARNWRSLGARRVSIISPLLLSEGLAAAQTVIDQGRYEVETIPHPFMASQALQRSEEVLAEERAKLGRLIEEAKQLGARSIYMTTGGHGSLSWEEAAECFSAAIAPCVAQAREAGIAIMIENALPLYADLHIAHSLRDAIKLAEMADIGVCLDVFGCWAEAGLRDTIERVMPRCQLIQIADYVYGDRSLPSRAVPGDGAIPLRGILDWALSAGYDGAFDLELIGPRIDEEGHLAATRRAADHVSEILQSLGA